MGCGGIRGQSVEILALQSTGARVEEHAMCGIREFPELAYNAGVGTGAVRIKYREVGVCACSLESLYVVTVCKNRGTERLGVRDGLVAVEVDRAGARGAAGSGLGARGP